MRRQLATRRAVTGFTLAVLSACGAPDAPRPATPAGPAPLAEAATTITDIHLAILNVERVGEAVLEVRFALTHAAGAKGPFVVTNEFASHPQDAGSIADVSLIDASGQRRTFVIRDAQNRPACSTGIAPIAPGGTRELWARFLAPPPGVTRVTVRFPGVSVPLDVPIVASRIER